MAHNLRAVVYEPSPGDRRLGRLEDEAIVDAGPADEVGFVPTPEGWQQHR